MAIDRNKTYKLKNRSGSTVYYSIPELNNLRRELAPGEEIIVTYNELEKLSFKPGGRTLMANFLQVRAEEVTKSLGVRTEPEYYMNEQQIVDMLRTGSLDQLLDCLDFAPIGVKDLIKTFAVKLPLTDTRKIAAIKEKTGFDVTKAIEMEAVKNTEEPVENKEEAKPASTPAAPARRTNTNYKVVNKE